MYTCTQETLTEASTDYKCKNTLRIMSTKIRARKKLTQQQRLQWVHNPLIFSVMLRVVHSGRRVHSTKAPGHFYSHHYNSKKSSTLNLPHLKRIDSSTPTLPQLKRAEKSSSVNLPPFKRAEHYRSGGSLGVSLPHFRRYKVSDLTVGKKFSK